MTFEDPEPEPAAGTRLAVKFKKCEILMMRLSSEGGALGARSRIRTGVIQICNLLPHRSAIRAVANRFYPNSYLFNKYGRRDHVSWGKGLPKIGTLA